MTGAEPSKGLTPELWMFLAAEYDLIEICREFSDEASSLGAIFNLGNGLKSVGF